jgi:hypothetical protein
MTIDASVLGEQIRAGIQHLAAFISTDAFIRLVRELRAVLRERHERHARREHPTPAVVVDVRTPVERPVEARAPAPEATVPRAPAERDDARPTLVCVVGCPPDRACTVTVTVDGRHEPEPVDGAAR